MVNEAEKERTPLSLAEENDLGLNHCEAGAMIVSAWKLEGAIGDAIMYHHDYSDYTGTHKDILYSVAAANRFISLSEIGFAGNRHPDMLPPAIWDVLQVDRYVFDGIEEDVNTEIKKAEVFLKINHL